MPSNTTLSEQILGKTVHLKWTDGPTKGTTHAHVFHEDGTVEWHALDGGRKPAPNETTAKVDRPGYLARDITEQVVLMSYLSNSGYTLTVTLNFRNQTVVGVASNDKTWAPVEGTFSVTHHAAVSIGGA